MIATRPWGVGRAAAPAVFAAVRAAARLVGPALVLVLVFSSCSWFVLPEPVPAPEEVRVDALAEALRYIGMEYEWGGDDVMPRGIDCSGLVINAYAYAASIHGYTLLFRDATSVDLHDSYTEPVAAPEPGDLIFMGSADSTAITHVAVFQGRAAGVLSFVDSTYIPEQGVDGVSERSYPEGDARFKSFGRLRIRPRR